MRLNTGNAVRSTSGDPTGEEGAGTEQFLLKPTWHIFAAKLEHLKANCLYVLQVSCKYRHLLPLPHLRHNVIYRAWS